MQVDVAAVMVVYCKCGWKRVQPALYATDEFVQHRISCKMFYVRRRMVLAGMVEEPPFTRRLLVGVRGFDPVFRVRDKAGRIGPSFEIVWLETLESHEGERDGKWWENNPAPPVTSSSWPDPDAPLPPVP